MTGWANHSPGDPWGDCNAGRERERGEDEPSPGICPDCRLPTWPAVEHRCDLSGEENQR